MYVKPSDLVFSGKVSFKLIPSFLVCKSILYLPKNCHCFFFGVYELLVCQNNLSGEALTRPGRWLSMRLMFKKEQLGPLCKRKGKSGFG